MKIIALGDFHGTLKKSVIRAIKKEQPELILCTGDLASTDKIRSIIFTHWKELKAGKSMEEILGKKAYHSLHTKAIESMEPILKGLNSLGLPVILIWGNSDYMQQRERTNPHRKPLDQRVKKYPNITFIKRERALTMGDCQVLAFSGYRFPGQKGFAPEKKHDKAYQRRVKAENATWKRRLRRLFLRLDKKRTTIFLCHDPPRGYLDRIRNPSSPLNGTNLGDEYFTAVIKKKQPDYCVCGHMHENPGKKKLGKTTIINTGAALEGSYAVIGGKQVHVLRA